MARWRESQSTDCLRLKWFGNYVVERAGPFPRVYDINLARAVCSGHFAKEAKGALIIRDKDPKEVESNGLIHLT
jgi:hypothetical protein